MLLSKEEEQLLKAYEEGVLEYWDSGNYDDCFELGIQVGYAMAKRDEIKETN